MAEEKYSWKNLIFNPTTDEAKNAVGKEVYYSDAPLNCIDYANKDNTEFLGVLDSASESNAPFYIRGIGNWNCIIVKKELCYEDQVKQWIEENNLKVGDYVKVTRRAENHADGLDDYWYDLMRDSVGKILKVKEISNFIMLDNGINYPYFVLEKNRPHKPKYVPFESKEEFVRRYTEVKEGADFDTFEDNLFQCGMWLRYKENGDLILVTGLCDGAIYVRDFTFGVTWKEVLNKFEFLDGAPCGKESKDE